MVPLCHHLFYVVYYVVWRLEEQAYNKLTHIKRNTLFHIVMQERDCVFMDISVEGEPYGQLVLEVSY